MNQFARPGKKRLTVTANPRAFPIHPLTQARRSYTSKRKLQVLTYWATPSIVCEWNTDELICPSIAQVSEYFGGIPESCISEWRRIEGGLVGSLTGARQVVASSPGSRRKWPQLDNRLYDAFIEKRKEGQIVRQGWFRIMAQKLFQECYCGSEINSKNPNFCFSRGWFTGFLSHYRITIRFTTNRAQKIPQDYLTPIIEFFRFNRRVSQLRSEDPISISESESQIGRYILSRIVNMDQTPAPFEYLSGRTYAQKGSTTVWAKAEKSGWDKRQATIQLTVLADGTMLKPWILFKGKGQLPLAETSQYDTRTTVKFNSEGYANEHIILEWIQEQLIPVIHRKTDTSSDNDGGPGLINQLRQYQLQRAY